MADLEGWDVEVRSEVDSSEGDPTEARSDLHEGGPFHLRVDGLNVSEVEEKAHEAIERTGTDG